MDVAAIVVAGGSSSRMGFDKLRADLNGTPVYLHSLQTLQACAEIREIVLVASEKNCADFEVETKSLTKVAHVIAGGAERHLSVAAGLAKISSEFEWICVHDAARPLLSAEDLSAVLALAQTHEAAALAEPVADTLKRADSDGCVIDSVDRAGLWKMQTPQVFRAQQLRAAYKRVLTAGELVTDEVSAVAKKGVRVKLVAAQDLNFKITYPCDIALARLTLQSRRAGEK
jgi:2-C-methyl-D-erythritol 4-phosphate cytidylyltransferase